MKKFLLASVALASLSGAAFAADLPSHKAPVIVTPPAFSWNGLYGGVNIGYGFGDSAQETGSLFYPPPAAAGFAAFWSAPQNLSGVLGGGQVGYNYQFSPWLVFGVEADIQAADVRNQSNFAGPGSNPLGPASNHIALVNTNKNVDWFGTVRGRIGVTGSAFGWSNLLVYGTGGFAYGQVEHNVSVVDWFFNFPQMTIGKASYFNTNTGWTAGGGVEWSPMSFPAWSVKVEYLYTDLGSTTLGAVGLLNVLAANNPWVGTHSSPTRFHTVRAGLNWHFNPFASAPVLAKY